MYPLLIVILALLVVALYPVIRDFFRQRRSTLPAYVEGLKLLLDGKKKEAAIKLKQAVDEDTNNIDAYIRLGDILLEEGDIARALRIHESLALRRNLKPAEERQIYQTLVRDYLKTDRKVKAIPLLEELIRLDRNDIDSREKLLELYIENASWDKCEQLARNIGREDPKRIGQIYASLGYAYGKIDPRKGQHWLEEALKLNPKSILARTLLGDLLLAQNEIENAVKVWKEVLNIAPEKNHIIRERLEQALYELGRYEEATQIYRQLLQRVPEDVGLAIALSEIYAKKEDTKAAIALLEKRNSEANANVALAKLLLQEGQVHRAQTLLEDAVRKMKLKTHPCRKCNTTILTTELRCPYCRSWQED